jgi:hypothetical protein
VTNLILINIKIIETMGLKITAWRPSWITLPLCPASNLITTFMPTLLHSEFNKAFVSNNAGYYKSHVRL